jgi:hypothetical protein
MCHNANKDGPLEPVFAGLFRCYGLKPRISDRRNVGVIELPTKLSPADAEAATIANHSCFRGIEGRNGLQR